MPALDWVRRRMSPSGAADEYFVASSSWTEDSKTVHGQRVVGVLPEGTNLASGAAPAGTTYGSVATSTTPVLVLAGNASRIGFRLKVHNGTSYVGFDASVTDDGTPANEGEELFPKDVIQQYGSGCYQGPLYAVRASGTGEIRIWEW